MTRAPLRILFAATPDAPEHSRADEKLKGIQAHLRGSKLAEVVPCWAAQPDDLRRALLEVEPQIVHFGGSELVPRDALVTLFAESSGRVRGVVLDACYAADLAEALSRHVDCVIGVSDQLSAVAAARFAGAFYEAVGSGKPIEAAFRLGGSALPLDEVAGDRILMLHERPGVRADKLTLVPGRSPWALAVAAAALPVGFAIAAFIATRSGAPMAPLVVTTSTASAPATSSAPPGATAGSASCRGDGTCLLTTAGSVFDGSYRSACLSIDGRRVVCEIQGEPARHAAVDCRVNGGDVPKGAFSWSKCAP